MSDQPRDKITAGVGEPVKIPNRPTMYVLQYLRPFRVGPHAGENTLYSQQWSLDYPTTDYNAVRQQQEQRPHSVIVTIPGDSTP